MLVLYILNIALYMCVPLALPVYFTRAFRLGALNILTIPLLFALPTQYVTSFSGPLLFLDGGLYNPYFQYALLVDNAHSILEAVSIVTLVTLFLRKPFSRWAERLLWTTGTAHPRNMRQAALLFLALYLVAFVLLAQPSYGLLNWIASPRTGYQLHRAGAGQWYALSLLFLSVSAVLATLYARSSHAVALMAPVYLFFVYLLGSKGQILLFAIYLLVVLALRRYRYFPFVALVTLGGSLALVVSIFVSSLGGVGLEEIASYSDYFVNAARYYERYLNGSLPLFHGEILLSGLWGLVPRAVYPDKPFVYGIIKVIDVFYPGAAEQTSTPAFATVDYFADFGWLGVLLYGLFSASNFLTAALYVIVLPRLRALDAGAGIPHPRALTYAFLLLAAPSFLSYFEFPLNAAVFGLLVLTIELVNRVRVRAYARPRGVPVAPG